MNRRTLTLAVLGMTSAALAGLTYAMMASPPEPGPDTMAQKIVQKMKETEMKTDTPAGAQAKTRKLSRSGWDITPWTERQIEAAAVGLTDEERRIILAKGTEPAFCGNLLDNKKKGVYVSKLGGLPLFKSSDKFDSGTGWPSFFQPFDPDHIVYKKDTTHGMVRVEILDARTGAHLGHVFDDGPKPTGLRYCLNSASLDFIEENADGSITWPVASMPIETAVAYFGGGCFWGLEDRFQKETPGVVSVISGYMGGSKSNPTYKEVCNGDTGHAEVVKVVYDPKTVSYEALLKSFFRYHDPTQLNRQGPDVGDQYRSAIYGTPEQVDAAKKFIADREANSSRFKGKKIVTEVATLEKAGKFYPAESYHQDYNERTGHQCYIPYYDEE